MLLSCTTALQLPESHEVLEHCRRVTATGWLVTTAYATMSPACRYCKAGSLPKQCKSTADQCSRCKSHQGCSTLFVAPYSPPSASQTASWQFEPQSVPAGPRHDPVKPCSAVVVLISSMQQTVKATNPSHACRHLNMCRCLLHQAQVARVLPGGALALFCICRLNCMCCSSALGACTQKVELRDILDYSHIESRTNSTVNVRMA